MDIEEGPIWAVLRDKAPDRAPLVKDLAEEAAGKLRLVRDTFPTYTLHDEVHSANVVRLMGDLLGDRVAELSGLEAAMLLLAAYHHDIGMVYTPDELAAVATEPEFAAYLSMHHEDYLAVRAAGGEPPLDVLERYCRSRHADRVSDHLGGLSDRLLWGKAPLYRALTDVCRSHNLDVGELKSDRFDPHFLAECDLRFCALLLRLADILDLDESRAPRAIYNHLGLAQRRTARTAVSDGEWRKHLSADGFAFPSRRQPNYLLPFIAGPDHPAVEHDIRAFLDVIDHELRRCRPILDYCAPRWSGLALPGEVDRTNIIGKGYTYGAFRFELDRRSVLELFTGERLYEDPYVFIRELLQNAIDAVRLRQALGHSPVGAGVAVAAWEDGDGFLWVRVDDDGVGMDERTLQQYFLRVGRSYYNSAELRADLVRSGRSDEDFVAISRFGIGVLSCFIAGDRVELSTLRAMPDGSRGVPLRLSLTRDEEYFVLRQRPDRPTAMPLQGGADGEPGYRRQPGTSIAVRIDAIAVDVTADELASRVHQYVRHPPISVTFNGRPAGTQPVDNLDQPLLTRPSSVTVSMPDDVAPYWDLPTTFAGRVEVGALPLDLTAASPARQLRGQMVVMGARVPPRADGRFESDLLAGWTEAELLSVPADLRALCAIAVTKNEVRVRRDGDKLVVTIYQYLDEGLRARIESGLRGFHGHRSRLGDIAVALLRATPGMGLRSLATVPLDLLTADLVALWRQHHGVRWSHNGIALPMGDHEYRSANDDLVVFGGIAFSDHLRPDLVVSRGLVRHVPFAIHSAMNLTLRRLARTHDEGEMSWLADRLADRGLLGRPWTPDIVLGVAIGEPLTARGLWDREEIVLTERGAISAEAARSEPGLAIQPGVAFREILRQDRLDHDTFMRLVVIQRGLDLTWTGVNDLRVRSTDLPEVAGGLWHFPPLFFVPHETSAECLLRMVGPVNRNNPLARWLIDNATVLAAQLPVLFARIRRVLADGVFKAEPADLNNLLERVAAVRPELRPPAAAYLRDDSPEREWWTR